MPSKCIVCQKELPEGSKLPLCEFHKGVAIETAKKGAGVAGAIALTVGVAAKDAIVPALQDVVLPAASKTIDLIRRR